MSAGQLKLYQLVDLALCDPEVGAVNFNHLRTLLLYMLKINNLSNAFVDQNDLRGHPFDNKCDAYVDSNIATIDESIPPSSAVEPVDVIANDQPAVTNANININSLLHNQSNLESRISSLEKSLLGSEEFPSNHEILNKEEEEESTPNSEDGTATSPVASNNNLHTIWKHRNGLRRLDGAEEAIEKLFSLMNDILRKDNSKQLTHEYGDMKSNLLDLKKQLDELTDGANENKGNIDNNKSLIEEWRTKMDHLDKHINETSRKLLAKIDQNCNNIDSMQVKTTRDHKEDKNKSASLESQIGNIEANIDQLMKLLDEKADLRDIEKNVDDTELNKKVDVTDFEIIQNAVTELTGKVHEIEEGMLKLSEIADLDRTANEAELEKIRQNLEQHISNTDNSLEKTHQNLEQHISNTDNNLSAIRKDIEQFGQKVTSIYDEEKLNEMVNNIDGLSSSMSNKDEEINSIKDTIGDISRKLSRNGEQQKESDDVHLRNEEEIPSREVDNTIVAAIQHLAQENRRQITSIQGNIKMLQKLQMPVLPVLAKDDNNVANGNTEMFEVFQNHLLTIEEEQGKQAGHISNMVDDYKEEFNRKQLHIDALYEYIEKLQQGKADREDIYTEMNIKADKQSLDSKVSMTVFDERYQLLEQSLQQALTRLDLYVEQETSLKLEFSKLSEDLNSKMDTDAGKQLKKFLNDRLKAIQASRTHLSEGNDERNSAAGLRKPMSLNFNCLSCDRTIDVSTRGVISAVPYNLPARTPLTSTKFDKDVLRRYGTSYNSMIANRACGGTHTSVNVNTFRMMKIDPLQSSKDPLFSKSCSINDLPLADSVIGSDGQLYRGRVKSQDVRGPKPSRINSGKSKARVIQSATTQTRPNDHPTVSDRPHTASNDKKVDSNTIYLPLIRDLDHGQPPSQLAFGV